VEVISHREVLKYLLIVGHETPRKDADLLIEGNLVDAAGQVRAMAVNDVLEVLAQAHVQRFQVDLALHDFE